MAGKSSVEVRGLSDLLQAMEQLPREIVSKNGGPLRSALAKAAKVIKDEAVKRAPSRTGLLKREIRTMRERNPGEAAEAYRVGVRRGKKAYADTKKNRQKGRARKTYQVEGNAYYWRFLEFGTAKMPAAPFLRPAFESKKDEALQRFRESLEKGVASAVKKAAKK